MDKLEIVIAIMSVLFIGVMYYELLTIIVSILFKHRELTKNDCNEKK